MAMASISIVACVGVSVPRRATRVTRTWRTRVDVGGCRGRVSSSPAKTRGERLALRAAGGGVDEDEKLKRFLRRKGVPIPPSQPGSIAERAAKSTPSAEASSRGDDDIAELRFFDLDTVRERWEVPWGGWRVFFGLSGWTASFVLTAGVVAPVLLALNGVDPRTFDPSQKTEYLLAIQAAETGITFGVLWLLLRGYRDDMDAAGDWFVVDPSRDAFGVDKGWLRWALYGYVAVFVSIAAVAAAFNVGEFAWEYARNHIHGTTTTEAVEATHRALGESVSGGGDAGEFGKLIDGAGGATTRDDARQAAVRDRVLEQNAARRSADGPGTIDAVLPLIGGGDDQGTRLLSLLAVTSVFAPALEEVVFRGFLMASLTRWLPTPGAVVFSSVVFAGAHLSARDFPQLVCLGMVLGFSYARTRNLLTPMTIHAMWNSGVLVVIAGLMATGQDIPGL